MKLTCMRGYSGSGKSTRAREIADETAAVIVCRDDLRKMLLGSYWTGRKDDEDRVSIAEEAQVTALLRAAVPVVVDATHLHTPYLRKWAKLATRLGVEFEVVDVRTPLWQCVFNDNVRAKHGERHVGHEVIAHQAKRTSMKNWPAVTAEHVQIDPYTPAEGLPKAIIVDIDGTLAHIPEGGRSPYDYSRVSQDQVDEVIQKLIWDWYDLNGGRGAGSILVVSGRDDACRTQTKEWLWNTAGIDFARLLMRPADAKDERGGKLPDYIVKLALFNEHIRDHYDVQFVLDDRQQVVEMWRRLGLKCLQVEPGEF